jgi:multidrug resistance protein
VRALSTLSTQAPKHLTNPGALGASGALRTSTYVLAVLFAINLMNFFDRQLLGAVGEAVRREWGLNDTTLGALGTAFTLLYAVVGLPFGRLTDRAERRKILAGGVFVWSVFTALSGAARNFWQLFSVRLLVGVGEATCSPASTSLVGDIFPKTERARAMAVFMLGLPIGLGLANAVGATIAQAWGWRTAFYLAAVPGLLCAVAALRIEEPARGLVEEHAVGVRQRTGSPFRLVLSIPTMWWVIASGALHNFNMYALGAFLASFLIRYHGVSLRQGGIVAAVTYGFSGVVGLVGGGMLADSLCRKRADGRLLVATWAIVICTPLMFLSLLRPRGDVLGFSLLMGLGCSVMYAYYSTVYSTIHDVVEPSLRGTAMALYFFAMYVLGASLGPIGTGIISDYFTFKAAAAAGAVEARSLGQLLSDLLPTLVGGAKGHTTAAIEPFRAVGLHEALYLVPILGVLLAVVLFAASRTVSGDVSRLQAWMREQSPM